MITTVILISLHRLRHSRVELLLTFMVPIAFFSIFALIFGGGLGGGATSPRVKVLAVDLADNQESLAALRQLHLNPGLRFFDDLVSAAATGNETAQAGRQIKLATEAVRRGVVSVAIVLEPAEHGIQARLLTDSSDQIAGQLVSAVVQRAVAMSNSQRLVAGQDPTGAAVRFQSPEPSQGAGHHRREHYPAASGVETSARSNPSAEGLPGPPDTAADPDSTFDPLEELTQLTQSQIAIEDVLGGDSAKPIVSMYAAGIAVMFLLFGATGGGGVLLEEQENGTLDRLFATRMTMDDLLMGKWVYLTVLGFLQTTLMFCWGQVVFGIDLWGHADGFLVMTMVTAGAAASFGLLLATLCRTRGQLNGLSVVLVLAMSALGGSMVPRYIMSEGLQRAGWWTFNAWALDGYTKVFWRDLPVVELWPQMAVLMISGFCFLVLARMFAVRWETC